MVYLLTLDVGAERLRIAEKSIAITSDGGTLRFQAGLGEFDWFDGWSLGADVDVEDLPVLVDGTVLDGPGLRRYLGFALGELARITEGDAWEAREVLFRGRVSEPEIGPLGGGASFSLRRITGLFRRVDPSDDMVIGSEHLRDLGYDSELALGKVVPTVFGSPGGTDSGLYQAATPGYWLKGGSPPTFVVAAHPVEATSVEGSPPEANPDDRVWGTLAVTSGYPSTVTFAAAGTVPQVSIYWRGSGYGCRRAESTEPVKTAGHMLERQLQLTGDYDAGRTAAAVELLPHRLDGYYDQQVDPLDWIRSNLLPILPFSLIRGPLGWYPLVWRAWLPGHSAVADLSTDRADLVGQGRLVADGSDELVNEVRLRYALDAETREFTRQLTHTGDDLKLSTPAADRPSVVTSPAARFSYNAAGGTLSRSIDTDVVWRQETAAQICDWMVARYALPTWVGEYDLHQRHRYRLTPGDVFLLSDSEMGLTDQLATVEGITDSVGSTRIRIRTVEAP